MDKKNRIKKKFRVNMSFTPSVAPIVARQTELGQRFGLQQMTPPSPDLLFDPTGKEVRRRDYQWGQRAGLESGRYLKTKNEQYMLNYLTALEKFPNKEFWNDTIERLKLFIKEHMDVIQYTDFLGDVFPPLNDWYPSNKGYTRGGVISYKGFSDIDLVSDTLRADIEETLDILGVDEI